MRNDDIFNSNEFHEACEEYCEKIAAEYPNDSKEPHVFSEEFENKMAKLLEEPPKRRFNVFNTVGKRVAVILIVLALTLTTAVFSVEALRVPVIEFFMKVYEEFTSLFVDDSDTEYNDDFVFEPKTPKVVLDGFEVTQERKNELMYQLEYISADGRRYYYKQNTLYQNQMIDILNSDYTELIESNGINYYYYFTDDSCRLVWFDETYAYMVSGDTDKDEMLKVAQSVE